jgi:hypothetical protein
LRKQNLSVYRKGGDCLQIYQDFEASRDVLKSIFEYKRSSEYRIAQRNLNYYKRNNEKILNRAAFLKNVGITLDITSHKLRNGLFQKMTKQVVFYTIGNGLTLESKIKDQLGVKFEKRLIEACISSFWGGVSWNFITPTQNNAYELYVYNALEAFGLFDEMTGEVRAVIRFTQLTPERPIIIELYELEGLTTYRSVNGVTTLIEQKQYKIKQSTSKIKTVNSQGGNYGRLPIVPMYANMLHEPEFSDAFKAASDAYDFINSDLIDTLTQIEGAYWFIRNYGGNSAEELIAEMQKWKAVVESGDAGAESFLVEVPFEGKSAILENLSKDMYNDFMALDLRTMTGGNLTNVAINVAKTDLDLKADELEWQVVDAVETLLQIIGIQGEEPSFKRRSISNDTEIINNISSQLADGVIDIEEAVFMTPNVLDSRKMDLLKRLELANTGVPPDDVIVDEGDGVLDENNRE